MEKLPSESKLEYRELSEVFSTWKSIEAGFVKSLLESNGINCVIQNPHYPSLTPVGSAAVRIKVMVETEDKIKAKEIVNQYYKDLRENE